MSETLPRWGLPAVEFIETDPEKIKSELITGYETASGRTLAAGDPVRLFILSIADRFIQLRTAVNIANQQNLLPYAEGDKLDAKGRDARVERLPASTAITTLEFTLSQTLGEAYIIPAGFEVTNGTITFATIEQLVIPAGELTGATLAHCTTAGAVGNGLFAEQINTIVTPMPFLASAKNITQTTGGADVESDADYADRIRLAPNSYSVAGPTKAYEYHAYSVSSSIIDVSITSPSAGKVNIYPLLENGELPSDDMLQLIHNHLSADTIRPLTDHVVVLKPTAKEYKINVDYWISRDDTSKAAAITAAVDAAVEEYRIWQQSKIGRDITPDELIARVINAGASRVDLSTLQPTWTELTNSQVAQCTSITVNFKGYKDA